MAAQRVIQDRRTIKTIVRRYTSKREPWSLAELAAEYEVSPTTIRNYLIEEGVELRSPGGQRKSA